ncbi:anti-sigma factor antagonist [Bacillus sp. FJAT-27231]|uniref:STAS domain-containing protein n=1 Tax=Bacillus sp. FJAT-27231 TaxID=1679168 RepID=UPI000670B3B9|nr:STAS domain-containing protein [Bacillus sp. FJAT-27231]KMY54108.1 anti-sigma factor antagonist [Bacillus sp. FJAT-27231]
MSSFLNFSNYIRKSVQSLSVEVVDAVLHKMQLTIPEWEKEQAINMYNELLAFFGESLLCEKDEAVPEALVEWSKKNAAMQATAGRNISEIVVRYPPTRDVFNELLTDISLELGLSVKEHAFIIKRINNMLDISLNETFFAFERLSNEFKEETQKELAKLSAPIVPVKEGIVVLPLIGEVNDYRAAYIMENVIPKIAELEVDHVIVDFSGILTINTQIADYFRQIEEILHLMGMHVITTGLRPELAQTVVNAGIDFSRLEAYATVKQALESIQ